MFARRVFLRAIGLGLLPALLLTSCRHWQNGDYSRQQDTRDGGGGGGGGGSGGY
jgi:hypothetical protein